MLELPAELVLVLSGLVGTVVAQGLKSLGDVLKIDLSGQAAAVAGALVALVVASVNGLLLAVPAEYENIARAVLGFLVLLLAPAGIYDFLRGRKTSE